MSSGKKQKLYRNTGTNAAPVLVEIKEARDIDIPGGRSKIDDSDRGSDFMKYTDGLLDLGFNFKMTYRAGNANCEAIRNAILNGNIVEFACLSGPATTSGSEGFRFFGKVFTKNTNTPLTDGRTIDVEVAPAHYEEGGVVIDPSWYTVP